MITAVVLCGAYCLLTWVLYRIALTFKLRFSKIATTIGHLYNPLQIALNAFLIYQLSNNFSLTDPLCLRCGYTKVIEDAIYISYLSKYFDMIDTLLIILKNDWRRLSFLHVYHHGSVPIVWAYCFYNNYAWGTIYFSVFLNSIIHLIMYTHYYVTSLGFKNPYKKLLTLLQIIQFLLMITHCMCILFIANTTGVNPYVLCAYALSILIGFIHFYVEAYLKKVK